jgi:hypothetical protein
MKFRKPALLAIPLLAAMAAPMLIAPVAGEAEAAQARATPRGSLCANNEVVIFNCGVGRKMISVCGRRTPAQGTIAQYRFGAPGDIELAYPGPGQSPLTYAREMYSGGGAMQIRFSTAGHDYAVYSRTVRTGFRGRNNPQFSDGVMVRHGGRLVSNRACTTPVRIDGQPDEFMAEGTILDWPN